MALAPTSVLAEFPVVEHRDAELCVEVLGRELTAYIAGAENGFEIDDHLASPSVSALARLQATAEVVDAFAHANRAGLAAGWLREVGALPGETQSPAQLIREASDDIPLKAVVGAAAHYCADLA